ncbi:NADH-quinone oxidoreductase subunit D 2 [Actinomadura rubrobrunea]|uniref:NADH-quinone oxidoreductase subunit D n=1 Tax=Actinomadura rubrobrunea TaxID=115335 RepID=A0A9W6PZB3_9ACTN|nr:NADH-quinone oxidoreductase subunit D [Actinomadura rubrobrunea]GLW66945.1 NADH-quinone oxidoreductase subunit D 2 [Actinomadura rubrobrunea]
MTRTEERAAPVEYYAADVGDWDDIAASAVASGTDRLVVNMGPQHPSTHGVLRLVLTLDGETVENVRMNVGYLHTGIEKSMEFRTWTQGVAFCTRMDYLAPLFNEAAYSLAVERLLGVADRVPERAQVIRVMMMELNRISSHLVAIATFGLELGASTVMTNGFLERERVLETFELITGVRMNHGYIRPGGVVQDLPPGALDRVRRVVDEIREGIAKLAKLLNANPVFVSRTRDVAFLDLRGCVTLGVTGPVLRSAGLPWDLRKSQPYCGYETYDFEVPVQHTGDAYGRHLVRMAEMEQSLRIVEQCVERLASLRGPVMIEDKKIGWPARLALGADGLGNSPRHIAEIMGSSMEALIHHFKLVTEGFKAPAGQVYAAVESPRGELGVHLVSEGGTRPYRAHFRDPSFTNLQALPAMCEGGQVADVIAAVASLDPLMGGVDR